MESKPDAGIRLGAMILDHFAMTFVVGILSIPFFIGTIGSTLVSGLQATHEQNTQGPFDNLFLMLVPFTVYFCKDSFHGRSIAKRILKLQVVEHSTGQPASPIRCLVRNLSIMFWPIEVIATLANPERRLGDRLAGTRVIKLDDTAAGTNTKLNWVQVGLSFLGAFAFMSLLMFPFDGLLNLPSTEKIEFVEGSLNEAEANKFETLLADSLNNLSTVDVLIYDQIKGHEDLKYVSVIVTTENARDAFYDSDQREEITESLLLSVLPEGSFVGRVQYLNKEAGSRFLYSHYFDWREEQ